MSKGEDPHEYEHKVVCVNESKDAIRVTPLGTKGFEPFWLPKSVLHDNSEVFEKGSEGKLVVMEWFALKEGWD